ATTTATTVFDRAKIESSRVRNRALIRSTIRKSRSYGNPSPETLFICLDSGERAKRHVCEIEDPRISRTLAEISRVSSDGAFGQRSA
ncbi:hypothetical protein ALC56_14239, partial [Trachymyrmex septentrionalis]